MIIGFGFGNPLISILMLIATSLISYLVFRLFSRKSSPTPKATRSELRQYYDEQRRQVRELSSQFDLSDEEIEAKINEELDPDD